MLESLHGLAPQIPIRTIYRNVTPFIIADLVLLALLTLFPAISIWLPTLLFEPSDSATNVTPRSADAHRVTSRKSR